MTIETIKFSQMTDGGDLANNDKTPGLQSGANVLFNNPWTFLPPGTTAERPAPSAAVNFRLRFNTTDQLYEYYDAVLGQWTQLQESAFTQGPFVIWKADASIPDGQNLGALADGILRQTISAGEATLDILQIPLTGAYGGTGLNNGILTINLSAGSLGYVLTSDVDGNATWAPNGYTTDAVLLTPSGNQTITIHDLSLATGSMFAILGSFNSGSASGGFAGDFTAYSTTAALGSLSLRAADNAGNYANILTNASTSAARTWTLPDASGTIALAGTQILTIDGDTGSATPTAGVVQFTGASTGLTFSGATNVMTLGGILSPVNGGTGVNNGTSTLTLAGSLETIGAFAVDFTFTGATGVTFPTSGTLATTSSASGHVTAGNINELAWYAANGDTVSGLTTANDGVLITSGAGVPSISSTLPTAVQDNIVQLGAQVEALNMNTHLINNVVNPVSPQDAATKDYVDTAGGAFLPLAGGTMSGDISMGSAHRVTNALDPSAPQDYATKNYVDQTALNGTSVYTATTTSLGTVTQSGSGVGATLTNAGAQATLSVGGVNPPVGADVLVKDTATGMTAANEGIYTVTSVGSGASNWSMVRKTGYDTPTEINNTGLILIQNGTLAGTAWYNTNTIVTVDTTNFNYVQFGQTLANVNPNSIIGGNFDTNPWQRGVSFALGTGQGQTADMFSWINNGGSGGVTILKTADAPSVGQADMFSVNCLHIDVTTADASIGAADIYALRYNMEGYDWAQIAQNPFVLSFWHKHTVTGTYCVNFFNSAQDQYYIAEYTQAVADTWEFAELPIAASPAGGTWNYTTGIGVQLNFTIAGGSDWQGSAGSWGSGTKFITSNQVNGMSSTSNNSKFQFVKVESGAAATAFPFEAEQVVTDKCQRYYESGMTVGKYFSAATSGYSNESENSLACFNGNGGATVYYRTTKRANPTFNIKAHDGTSGQVLLQTVGNVTPSAINAGTNIATLTVGGATNGINFYWEADAAV